MNLKWHVLSSGIEIIAAVVATLFISLHYYLYLCWMQFVKSFINHMHILQATKNWAIATMR